MARHFLFSSETSQQTSVSAVCPCYRSWATWILWAAAASWIPAAAAAGVSAVSGRACFPFVGAAVAGAAGLAAGAGRWRFAAGSSGFPELVFVRGAGVPGPAAGADYRAVAVGVAAPADQP